MNNSNFDNKYSNIVVSIIGTIIRTFERSIVVFWDGLRAATVHGTPSLVGFFAAIAPVVTPAPMSAMTAIHMMEYLGWYPWQAWLMAVGLEVVGFPLWVFTTEAIFIDGWKGTTRQISLAIATGVYQLIIITINAIMSWQNGDGWTLVGIFFLACFVPALGGMAYSYSNRKNEAALDRERQEMLDAQVRKANADLQLEKLRIKTNAKYGIPAQSYAVDTPQVQAKPTKGDWRRDSKYFSQEDLKAIAYSLSVEELMTTYHLEKRTAFQWKENAKKRL